MTQRAKLTADELDKIHALLEDRYVKPYEQYDETDTIYNGPEPLSAADAAEAGRLAALKD